MDLRSLDEPQAATPEEHSLIHEPVKKLEPKPAVMVAQETPVAEAIAIMVEKHIGCVLVGTPEQVVGVFTERDLLLKVAHRLDELSDLPVSGFMTREPEMLEQETPLAFALNRMSVGDFRHLPLTEKGKLRGIISQRDFLGLVFQWYPELAAEAGE